MRNPPGEDTKEKPSIPYVHFFRGSRDDDWHEMPEGWGDVIERQYENKIFKPEKLLK